MCASMLRREKVSHGKIFPEKFENFAVKSQKLEFLTFDRRFSAFCVQTAPKKIF